MNIIGTEVHKLSSYNWTSYFTRFPVNCDKSQFIKSSEHYVWTFILVYKCDILSSYSGWSYDVEYSHEECVYVLLIQQCNE